MTKIDFYFENFNIFLVFKNWHPIPKLHTLNQNTKF